MTMQLLSGFTTPASWWIFIVHMAIPPLSVIQGTEEGPWPRLNVSESDYKRIFSHFPVNQGFSSVHRFMTYFTYMGGHSTIGHLINNMIMLSTNAPLVEEKLGSVGLTVLYLLSGAIGISNGTKRLENHINFLQSKRARLRKRVISCVPEVIRAPMQKYSYGLIGYVPGLSTMTDSWNQILDRLLERVAVLSYEHSSCMGASAGVAALMGFNSCLFLESLICRLVMFSTTAYYAITMERDVTNNTDKTDVHAIRRIPTASPFSERSAIVGLDANRMIAFDTIGIMNFYALWREAYNVIKDPLQLDSDSVETFVNHYSHAVGYICGASSYIMWRLCGTSVKYSV
eukprot:CFRG5928T1